MKRLFRPAPNTLRATVIEWSSIKDSVDMIMGDNNTIGLVDDIDSLINQDSLQQPYTGLVSVILGRIELGGPSSPFNLFPAYAEQAIELQWEATAQASLAGFEISRNDQLIASTDANTRFYEDNTALKDTAYTYRILSIDSAGQRSDPIVLSALNDHVYYPVLAGEVYSDTLAELFWVDVGNDPFSGNRDVDIYRDGVKVASRRALSWLDNHYDAAEHEYSIYTNPGPFGSAYRLRSNRLRLPPQAGTRAPASVGNPQFSLISSRELVLSWEPAA